MNAFLENDNRNNSSVKILIVDDEKSIRFSFASILKDAGYEVFSAENQLDAMDILSANELNVAIIDRLLGPHNGMDLVDYINREHSFCITILISAYPSFESASEGFKHNLFAYLQKPIKRETLCTTVKKAVSKGEEIKKLYNQIKV